MDSAIFFLPVHDKNVAMYRRILEVTLPVQYDEAWFKNTVSLWSDFARILYFKDIPVGVVGGRIETEGGVKRLYIMTLAVLAAYRGRGLGTCTPLNRSSLPPPEHAPPVGAALIAEVTGPCLAKHADVAEVYVHVHVGSEAVAFYSKLAFTRDSGDIKGYYANHRAVPPPPDACIFRRAITAPPPAAN
jgi:GNAT superfamily N-acetyltransferase